MKTLVVLLGPTGVGKTALSVALAKQLNAPILSSDSRQIYKEIEISTAAPSPSLQQEIPHYFIGTKELSESYSAGQYEEEVHTLLPTIFKNSDFALMAGGSMLYIDAVCNGMDNIPQVSQEIREQVQKDFLEKGLDYILQQLKQLDPIHYKKVDKKNHKRVIHAVEICISTGRPYSSLLTQTKKEHPFRIIKIGLQRDRAELYQRINQRVEEMIKNGLMEEAKKVYPLKQYNSLNTVGLKEIFAYWDGELKSKARAIELIKQDSRRYAKRQLTWFRRDKDIHWFHPSQQEEIFELIRSLCASD